MRKEISFDSRGNKLVGYLFLPDRQAAGSRLPTVVVIGPADGTKERAPSIYSERAREPKELFLVGRSVVRHWLRLRGERLPNSARANAARLVNRALE